MAVRVYMCARNDALIFFHAQKKIEERGSRESQGERIGERSKECTINLYSFMECAV